MERVDRSRVPAAFSVICRQSAECIVMGWTQPSLFKTASVKGHDGMNHYQEERGGVREWILER
jgi:hypothetical protein